MGKRVPDRITILKKGYLYRRFSKEESVYLRKVKLIRGLILLFNSSSDRGIHSVAVGLVKRISILVVIC